MINLYKKEFITLFIIFVFKIIILTFLPLTGDEAYFIKWAQNLSSGYYDHPPMVAWVIYLLSFLNDSYVLFRLFSVFTTIVTAFIIYKISTLYTKDKNKSLYVSMIFLASPVDILLSLMTNDIPLLLFGSLGTLFLLYSLEKKEWFFNTLLAGIFLGLAFLSKYFAVFLMLSLLIFALIVYKKKAIKNIILVSIVISVFIFQNLYFNYNSCWNNIMFNFFARTENTIYNIKTVLGYFLLMSYIFTPWGLYYLFKSKFENSKLLKLLLSILVLSFSIFFIVSLKKSIGLHWFLLFTPYMFLLFYFLDKEILSKVFKYNIIFTFLHIAILLILIFLPKSLLQNHKKYSDVVMFTQTQKVCEQLDKLSEKRIFTFGYSTASILSYHCKRDVLVLFSTSKYGRLDDKLLDVRELKNKDIILFDKKEIKAKTLENVCTTFSTKQIDINKAKFYSAECKNFKYDMYKKLYLDIQKEKFYNIPDWLPIGECYFNDRYYNGER
ncbi:MAG: hypothetical protein COB17_09905 [Sulfurimonas sp.]|nr:MAG: hypothetical protein COB17_09905 [Sulfurimonas sp.]